MTVLDAVSQPHKKIVELCRTCRETPEEQVFKEVLSRLVVTLTKFLLGFQAADSKIRQGVCGGESNQQVGNGQRKGANVVSAGSNSCCFQ